jgi:hypothetical protein
MRKRHIKYDVGQWFAVPLRSGGYALGVIVRGSYRTRGGLGYFFGPRYGEMPLGALTLSLQPIDAILIAWFGDLGIIEGRWPLIDDASPFGRSDWPVPKFGRRAALDPSMGWLVEYDQDAQGFDVVQGVRCQAAEIVGLPEDGVWGADAIEAQLTKLLSGT